MRILFDARSLGRRPSGIGMYIYNMVETLLLDSSIEIALATDVAESKEMKNLGERGLQIFAYGKPINKSFALYGYYRYLQKLIHQVKPDIFWEGNTMVPIRITNPYGRMFVTIHDMFPITYPEAYGKIYPYYFQYGINKTIKNFDTFIFNSDDTKRETEKYFPAIKTRKEFIGYIPVPKMPSMEITDNHAFFYAGNLEIRKGTDLLLAAYRSYREQGGHRSLRLAGKIREEAIDKDIRETREYLKSSSIEKFSGLQYLGYLSPEDRNLEYASCACFLFPSRAEGFGIPVIEAMNYYKPIIAGDLGTLHEIVGDCIHYTPITSQQKSDADIKALAQAMLEFDQAMTVSKSAYDAVIQRYLPEHILEIFQTIL